MTSLFNLDIFNSVVQVEIYFAYLWLFHQFNIFEGSLQQFLQDTPNVLYCGVQFWRWQYNLLHLLDRNIF